MKYLLTIVLTLMLAASATAQYAGIGLLGDSTDAIGTTRAGAVLMGGSTDVDEAFRWMIDRAGGGDFVIIRAGGSTGYNAYVYEMGRLNSVETLLIDSREKAEWKSTGDRIRQAEALFIAGGDQSNYVNFWTDSEVSRALEYLIHEKKVPVGGTSAGCAVLSEIVFDARQGTATAPELLANPFHEHASLSRSFMRVPGLEGTLTDQHYAQRKREGRHVALMARMIGDFGVINPKGIAVNEKTALCVDEQGNATVYGSSEAFFLVADSTPEQCVTGKPLTWDRDHRALRVYRFAGSRAGTPAFNLYHWPTGKPHQYWYVQAGELKQTAR